MIKEFKEGNIIIKVDHSKCTGLGECVTACPVEILEVASGKAIVKNLADCIECCACVNACPNKAIEHSSC